MRKHHRLQAFGAAGLILVAVSVFAAFGQATPAQAQIDISGTWNFDVLGFGSDPIRCPSTIEQTDPTFTIDTNCTDFGFGSLEGEIDVETGEFTASGNIGAILIEMAGTASQDGETIEGTWEATSFGFSGTLSAVRKPPGPTPTPLATLPAPVDITGTWRISFTGVFDGSCDAVFEQNGEELVVMATCSILETLPLQGTIDLVTGTFRLSGFVSLEGQVLSGGDSLTGTWSAFGFGGSLTGERVDDIEIADFSGEWAMVFLDEVSETCALKIEQGLILTSAVLDCEELGDGTLEGIVEPFRDLLLLFGTFGDVDITFSGKVSADGSYIFGYDFGGGPFDLEGSSGAVRSFIAVPAGALERGIVLLDCRPEAELVTNTCFYGGGVGELNEFPIEVQVVVAPVGGYGGFDATVSWPDSFSFRSGSSSTCDTASIFGAGSSVMLSCIYGSHGDFVGSVYTLDMTCDPGATGDIILSNTNFQDLESDLGPPTLINATVTCFAPQRGGPGQLIGDADCSSEVSSIDAALVLQYDAGLIERLDCQFAADVNFDGNIDSRDALLILQDVAGLL